MFEEQPSCHDPSGVVWARGLRAQWFNSVCCAVCSTRVQEMMTLIPLRKERRKKQWFHCLVCCAVWSSRVQELMTLIL